MDKVSVKMTVFFEAPLWVGVFERISEKGLTVCRVTFGAEPKDYEVDGYKVPTGVEITAGTDESRAANCEP